ncbi:hypothetical protein ACHHYP_13854 [Achlya hypogyna]|uniref:Ribosomal RNA methyltransferase FtsJ domain-containing protein n=1 Tax=Achlya hypogyna TaxID=1202772 RepID=A0A1V9YEL0_ACHHY|nr:hypothetical protein ACHHYP_13854 [Achlya hypogyna]
MERRAVLHVEETQVERFRAQVACLPGVVVARVQSPLLFLRFEPACWGALTRLRRGRISAHRIYEVDATCHDIGWIVHSVAMRKVPMAVFRVFAYPGLLQEKLVQLLTESGISADPKVYTHELHAVHCDGEFHFGVVKRHHDADEGQCTDDPRSHVPCRAYYKLEEALAADAPFPPETRAIDIGASPGGWTEFLASQGATVVAVDPGMLTVTHPRVLHLPMLLEQALPQIAVMNKFHLCVCDINIRPHLMAKLISSVTPYLHPQAKIVLTLKLSRRPTDAAVQQAVDDVCRELGQACHRFVVTWLHANTINERTLFAEKI